MDDKTNYQIASVNTYAKVAPVARRVKRGEDSYITQAAQMMLPAVRSVLPEGGRAVLIPIPNRSGHAGYTKTLAKRIGQDMSLPVLDALTGDAHRPLFDIKKEGLPPESLDLKFRSVVDIPKNYTPILIDNVLDTGHTAMAAYKAIGHPDTRMAVLGDTHKFLHNHWVNDIYQTPEYMAKKQETKTMMQHYMDLKERYPDVVLLFRDGDQYKVLNSDAGKVAKVTGLKEVLLADKRESHQQLTFPHYNLDKYLPMLVKSGLRVAIVDPLLTTKQKQENVQSSNVQQTNSADMKEQKTKTKEKKPEVKTENKAEVKTDAKTAKAESKEQKQEAKAETKQKQHEPRPPQLVTVNGEKVTHGHAFQSTKNPEDWYFTARLDGRQLRPMRMDAKDVEAYQAKTSTIEGLMQRYYPTKMEQKVTPEEYKADNKLSDGREVSKMFVYKESDTQRQDFGKYKLYAEVDGQKMSAVISPYDQSAYFDRVTTPAKLVESNFGEKLHLASAYQHYKMPEGVEVKDIRVAKDGQDGKWKISAAVGDNGRTEKKTLSYDDGFSLFQSKTATREQLAAKYLMPDIMRIASQKQEVSQGMKV
ncbi:DNA mismatch repair protein MutS [Bacteroides pyogenes]|uniref:DNA mismatch repair protein MutS n=1 Tax=Bacteroides pyogenes TaxID=310300 RepID=UPI001BAAAACF|nr:DNA mismatch repair protein MutS [Bacteroides pyogenes]MBR8726214.1 DNA mismatch repair protein MutS [Bacteroides pyogenes]MBR8739527.1 DNA mismatch repair protein MutS [Bacteroides pyogenes]MBR8755351.1 DNA mismatch repair protein MutS [Bacteroides pyogenes]MBR8787318.1 DNA mismatch repair protein MutS [Bacteroides pyogenes]MBR8792818.1 DNA mismatch repair protein MutS [Bacteroides pyogenes]